MKIFITGIAGVLGSTLAKHFTNLGHTVKGNDKARIEEAWRLEGYKEKITYLWKSSMDMEAEDIEGSDILIDCALESADRPFGIRSPRQTTIGNILPALGVLEAVRKLEKRPVCIYPSSFNVFYGQEIGTVLSETTLPVTSSLYGWSKLAAEELYIAYYKAYEVPVIVTRVGSAFGFGMRSDELVGRLIIHGLLNKDFNLRSPYSNRLWCFAKDIVRFYDELVKRPERYIGKTLQCAGNKGMEIFTNMEIAVMIKRLTNSTMEIKEAEYEPGEKIQGKPIDFKVDSSITMDYSGWYPEYTIESGLIETIEWFRNNMHRYSVE